ncbi:MAG: chloride channel protein [Kofleriaceae bacterium]
MKQFGITVFVAALVGAACGVASAVFLWLLAEATGVRTDHTILVWLLPIAGLAIGALYARLGSKIKGGNNLVIDTIHDGGPEIPFRMMPMVLIGTVLTHLFGGSAGREGTAVQMGASMADWIIHRMKLSPTARRQILAAGVAGGFGSVFGTPFAGMVFGMEFVVLGHLEYEALVPCAIAAFVGDVVARACGTVHTIYPTLDYTALSWSLAGKWLVVAVAIAAASTAFIELTHALKRVRLSLPIKMAIGGAVVVALWQLVGTDAYLGIGVTGITSSFDHAAPSAFAWKLVFTAITLGAGFLGGEVTPLFFIGATLGSALAIPLGIPVPLAAGVGLAAMFGTASNTPLALSVMAIELLGANALPHIAIVSGVAYAVASLGGRRSIYSSQRHRRTRLAIGVHRANKK